MAHNRKHDRRDNKTDRLQKTTRSRASAERHPSVVDLRARTGRSRNLRAPFLFPGSFSQGHLENDTILKRNQKSPAA